MGGLLSVILFPFSFSFLKRPAQFSLCALRCVESRPCVAFVSQLSSDEEKVKRTGERQKEENEEDSKTRNVTNKNLGQDLKVDADMSEWRKKGGTTISNQQKHVLRERK